MTVPTTGRTGQIITDRTDLDRLPAGSVVIPTWLGDRTEAGMRVCTRWGDRWYDAMNTSPVYPLGVVDPLTGGKFIDRAVDDGVEIVEHNGLGVLVVYDPRDQL